MSWVESGESQVIASLQSLRARHWKQQKHHLRILGVRTQCPSSLGKIVESAEVGFVPCPHSCLLFLSHTPIFSFTMA